MWQLDHKESWGLKNWCIWAVVLEKTLESLLDCKEIEPVHPKGNQSWIFIGRTDAEAKLQYFGHLMWRTDSLERPWCWERLKVEEKGMTEDEMVRWHHQLDGHEFEEALGLVMDKEAWRAAVYGVTKSWTWLSNWTELNRPHVMAHGRLYLRPAPRSPVALLSLWYSLLSVPRTGLLQPPWSWQQDGGRCGRREHHFLLRKWPTSCTYTFGQTQCVATSRGRELGRWSRCHGQPGWKFHNPEKGTDGCWGVTCSFCYKSTSPKLINQTFLSSVERMAQENDGTINRNKRSEEGPARQARWLIPVGMLFVLLNYDWFTILH